MSPFVVLVLAVAVVMAAVVVVALLQLLRTVRTLTAALRATGTRLVPLTEELQSELAVTSLEVDALSRSVARAHQERAARSKRRKPRFRH